MPAAILLAVDDSECSRAAVDDVVRHVRPDAATVHVLHVLELDHVIPPALDFARGSEYGADVAARVRASRDAAEALVSGVARRLRDARFAVTTEISEGDPRHTILDCAAQRDCDCIVLGSHGRRGLTRFLIGSVSDAVARHAHCSVSIVRPRAWSTSDGTG
jgi:nucleotide-binding universal stress UspA family protein